MTRIVKRFHEAFSLYGSKQTSDTKIDHYLGLDCLRGVAAVGVVLYHLSERLDLRTLLTAHGYLAVDFFFVLSGFVLARAYSGRLADRRIGISQFYLLRLIRLLPLVILGTLIAAVIEMGRPSAGHAGAHLRDTVTAFLLGSALIPVLFQTTLEHVVFPLNGPVWSLFFEAVANAVFAPCARLRIGGWALAPLMLLSMATLLYGSHRAGSIDFGYATADFWLGFPRVIWSFSAGLLLYRWRGHAPRLPFAVALFGLIVIFCVPTLGSWNWLFDSLCVLVVLPWLVFVATAARLGNTGRRVATWSGDLSYPLYALHYPIVRAVAFIGLELHLPSAVRVMITVATVIALIVISAFAYVLYDLPVRRWLSKR